MFKNKYIIGIDGKSGTGKTSLSKYLKEKYGDIKILHLDNFRNFSKSDFLNITKNEESIELFLDKYYDQEKVKKEIECFKEKIIIIEGCFIKKIEIDIDLYKRIDEYDSYKVNILLRLKNKNKGLTDEEAIAYLSVWDKIWTYYKNDV